MIPPSAVLAHRASSMTFSLTSGVRRCQVATNSRSATQSRHSSDSPWVLFTIAANIDLRHLGRGCNSRPPPRPGSGLDWVGLRSDPAR